MTDHMLTVPLLLLWLGLVLSSLKGEMAIHEDHMFGILLSVKCDEWVERIESLNGLHDFSANKDMIAGSTQWTNYHGTMSTTSLSFRLISNHPHDKDFIEYVLHIVYSVLQVEVIQWWTCSGARSLHGFCDGHPSRCLSFNQGCQQPGRERGATPTKSLLLWWIFFHQILCVGSRDGLVGCSAPTYVCRNGMLQVILLDKMFWRSRVAVIHSYHHPHCGFHNHQIKSRATFVDIVIVRASTCVPCWYHIILLLLFVLLLLVTVLGKS